MKAADTGEPVKVEKLEHSAIWRVCLDRPKANLVDRAMVASLTEVFLAARQEPDLKAICIESSGPNFSYGASIEEHLPDKVGAMLADFHELFRVMAGTPVTLLAAVRGFCLGGGLELASFCHRIFAEPGAKLGQPEIKLGVFAPVGSLLLAERMGRAAAEDLCLSGRMISAECALELGLVDELVPDPGAVALDWAREHLMPHSAAGLRHATRALRASFHRTFLHDLEEVERIYLEDLMTTQDAEEGIRSYMEKRSPSWRNA